MSRMWTKEHRERQKAFERRRYPTDLTDEEWERIRPILPQPARRGRKPKVNLREILNAICTAGVIDSETVKAPGARAGAATVPPRR
jgi:transposase